MNQKVLESPQEIGGNAIPTPAAICEQKMCLRTRATHSQTVTHMLMLEIGGPSERRKSRDMHQ